MTRKPPLDAARLPAEPAKQLMPEVLPAPEPVIPSAAPRTRVQSHLRSLMSLGAASLSLSCGPMVCDPLPPPAQCRNTGSVLSWLQVTVTASGATTIDVAVRNTDTQRTDGVGLTLSNVIGGTASQVTSSGSNTVITERVTPTSPTSVVELTFAATCEGTTAKTIRVVLTPAGLDGGAADGGVGSYTATISEL